MRGAGDPAEPEATPEPGEPSSGRIGGREVYHGRIVKLGVDRVRFPDGSTGELEIVRHADAAAVVPLLGRPDEDDPEIVLVRQYRYAAEGYLFEVPAGIPESADEAWETCARRELKEETGYRAGEIRYLTRIYTTPGFTDEVIRLYLATDLSPGRERRDADEFMETVPVRLSRALAMVRDGEIVDGKSVAALLFAVNFALGDRWEAFASARR